MFGAAKSDDYVINDSDDRQSKDRSKTFLINLRVYGFKDSLLILKFRFSRLPPERFTLKTPSGKTPGSKRRSRLRVNDRRN